MVRPVRTLELDAELRGELERIVRGASSEVRDVRRAHIVLLRA